MNDVATRRLLGLCGFFFSLSCLTNVAAKPNQKVLSVAVRGLSTRERVRPRTFRVSAANRSEPLKVKNSGASCSRCVTDEAAAAAR